VRVDVDLGKCKGYGLCVYDCEEVFDLTETGQVSVFDQYKNTIPEALRTRVHDAVDDCPEHAITIVGKHGEEGLGDD
jgi:ferredoxin